MLKRFELAVLLCLLAMLMPEIARAQGGQYSTIVSAVPPLPSCTPAVDITQLQPILWDPTVSAIKTCTGINTWTIISGGGGGTPGGANTQFQFNQLGTFAGASGITTPDGTNLLIKGQDPHVDVTAFGARVANLSGTASCTSGSPTVLVNFGSFLKIGDGITVYGCGTTNSLSTPSAPTVTPSLAAGETGTGNVVNSSTAGSTYSYLIVARDKFGAVTAPSSATTITGGQVTLGLQTATISSVSRTNDVVTVQTSAPNLLVVGSIIEMYTPTSDTEFNGWYRVAQIDSSTQFEVFGTPIDTRASGWVRGTPGSQTSGTVAYYIGNNLTIPYQANVWEYYICAERPGDSSYKLIGVTKPQGISNGYRSLSFTDWGSPYMDSQTYPSYVTNSSCTGSATNDPLTTTITNISGNILTVANNASQTLGSAGSGTTAVFDNGPNFLAAMNYAATDGYNATVLIPGGGGNYQINSFLQVPQKITVWDIGSLAISETVAIPGNVNWFGDGTNGGVGQFGFNGGTNIFQTAAKPAFYLYGPGIVFRNISFNTSNTNGGLLVVADNAGGTSFDYTSFVSGSLSSDYLSTGIVMRDTTGTVEDYHFSKVLFSGGPDQVTDKSWSPLVWFAPGQDGSGGSKGTAFLVTLDKTSWARRGIAFSSTGTSLNLTSLYYYNQGPITPALSLESFSGNRTVGDVYFDFTTMDTTGESLIADLDASNSASPEPQTIINLKHLSGGSGQPWVSGLRAGNLITDYSTYGNGAQIQNRDSEIVGATGSQYFSPYGGTGPSTISQALKTFTMPVHIPSGHSLYFDLLAPSSVAGSVVSGGSIPVGSWYYVVSATGGDGGETIPSSISTVQTTTSGNQQVNLTWTNPKGGFSSNVYRCTGTCVASDGVSPVGTWYRMATHVVGTAYSDSAATPGSGAILPTVTGTGISSINNKGVTSPLFQCVEGSAPAGVPGVDIIYCDSTQHAMVEIPNNGAPIVIGGGGSGITVNTNGVANLSQTNLNLLNSGAFNGLTITVTNTTLGNVQLGFSGTLGNSGLTNSSVSVNSQSCTLGSACTIPFQTNGTGNASQAGINNITSTTNAVGLTVTPVNNSSTNQVRYEITGVAATATALAANGTNCSSGQPALGVDASGNAEGCAAITDAQISFSNITTNNATTSQHGFAPKGSGSATDCYLGTSVFGACPTAVSAGSQYAVQYSSNGAGGFAGTTVPTTNGSYLCGYIVTTSAAVAPSCNLQGVPVDATNPATLLYSDRASYLNWTSGTALALPAVSGSFAANDTFVIKNSSTTLTITPNAGAVDLIDGASSGTLIPHFAAFVYQDATSGPGHWFTIKIPTFEELGATCTNGVTWSTTTGHGCLSAAPIKSGDAAGGDLSGTYPNPTVAQIQGGVIPTSAHVGGWSAGKQPIAANGNDISAIILCSDVSGSGTAQACTTAPSFTVSTDNCVTYTTTTSNTGTTLTVNVNSLGVKNVAIASSSGWTTTLTANILAANKPIPMCYDGTNWDAMQTGTGAGGSAGGSSGPNQSVAFSSATSASLTVVNSTAAITWNCYDNASPANAIYPSNVTVSSAFLVTFNFSVAQSGTCVVNSSGSGVYTASESGTSWSILASTHLMGSVVTVATYDSSGNQIAGNTVVDSSGNVTVNWLVSQSGKVVITP